MARREMMQEQERMGQDMPMEEEMGTEGGYCIEILVKADGSMSVSSEPINEEEYGEKEGTPVRSFGEAMKMVKEIVDNGGDMMAGEEDFQAGFGGPREGE